MPLDTSKIISKVMYNNVEIPLYVKPEQTKTVDLSMASGNQIISPDSGKVLSSVTINKPSTLIPDNIKKDVNIGGVVGTLESGSGSSTTSSNIITFEYIPSDKSFTISHDTLVEEGVDTEDKFFKINGISIVPKNGDIDWFYVSYGGTLDKTKQIQNLTYNHRLSGGNLAFYNIPSYGVPYSIGLQTQSSDNVANKTFIITLVLSN